MRIFQYALRDNERCASQLTKAEFTVRCRLRKDHDGAHEFASNSVYFLRADETAEQEEKALTFG